MLSPAHFPLAYGITLFYYIVVIPDYIVGTVNNIIRNLIWTQ